MVFDAISFLLGVLIFGVLVWGLQSYLNRPQKTLHTAELREVKQQLSSAKQDVERNKAQLSEKIALVTQLEATQAELKQRLPKLEGFERANADLRLQMQGFDNLKAKLETAQTELLSLKQKAAEFDALTSKLETVQTDFSNLKSKTSGFETLQTKAARTDELEAKMASIELEKASMLKEVNAAVLKASDAEAAQAKLKASLTESVAEVARVRAGMQQFEGLKARIDELEAKGVSNETQAKLDGLETELSAYKARVNQLETAANSELELARGRIRELENAAQAEVKSVIEPVQLEPVIEPVQLEPVIEPVQLEPVIEPVQPESIVESVQLESIVEPEHQMPTEAIVEVIESTRLENIEEPVHLENQMTKAPVAEPSDGQKP
jgi:chromosome segregation ATPase